eukprot:1511003-Amphidinium_carterae.1
MTIRDSKAFPSPSPLGKAWWGSQLDPCPGSHRSIIGPPSGYDPSWTKMYTSEEMVQLSCQKRGRQFLCACVRQVRVWTLWQPPDMEDLHWV